MKNHQRLLLGRLLKMLEDDNVRVDEEAIRAHSFDGLRHYRGFPELPRKGYPPDVIVTPTSTRQVSQILRLANRLRVPVTVWAGGTGLMAGAVAARKGVMIDVSKMNRVLQVSMPDRIATAQAGIVLEDLNNALQLRGLMLGHDPWTRPLATLGGAISTNSVGYTAAAYGSMGEQVLALEAVLPDGRVVETRPVQYSSTGFDLDSLFIGTEGVFGIITKATIRVFPKPECQGMQSFMFDSFERGFLAVLKMSEANIAWTSIDYGDFSEQEGKALLNLIFEGTEEETALQEKLATVISQEFSGTSLGPKNAREFWEKRHDIAERFSQRRQAGESYPPKWRFEFIHVSIPASKVLDYRKKAMDLLAKIGVEVGESGLWNQPELFSMVLEAKTDDMLEAGRALSRAVDLLLRLAQDYGGSMEYCHGVGLRLAHLMKREHGYGLEVMRKIKRALDPNGILNPGKLALK